MILVLNCGSQSIKWKVFDEKFNVVKEGNRVLLDQGEFQAALGDEFNKLAGIKISMVGHRVVHGKDLFRDPVEITKDNIDQLEALNYLAPLHNPFNVLGIRACQNFFKDVPQIAVFDTEFFKDLPEVSCIYALPEDIVKEFGFRRMAFMEFPMNLLQKRRREL